jgi:hypothetical protein
MADADAPLTPMDLARYYMARLAMRVDADHFQELCRTAAYAIDPARTAYDLAVRCGVTDLPTPEDIWQAGKLPLAPGQRRASGPV